MGREVIYIIKLSEAEKSYFGGGDPTMYLYRKDNGPSGKFVPELLPIYSEKYDIDWDEYIFGVVMSNKLISEKVWEIRDKGRMVSKTHTKNEELWKCGEYYFFITDAYSEPYGVYDTKVILLSNKKNTGKVFKSIKDRVGELHKSTKGYFTTEDIQLVEEYKNTFKNTN
jgi:hypothetical protein